MGQSIQGVCFGRDKVETGTSVMRVSKYTCRKGKGPDLLAYAQKTQAEDRSLGLVWSNYVFPQPDLAIIVQAFESQEALDNFTNFLKNCQWRATEARGIINSSSTFDHIGRVFSHTNKGLLAAGCYARLVAYELTPEHDDQALEEALSLMENSAGLLRHISMKTNNSFVLYQVFQSKMHCDAYLKQVRPRLSTAVKKALRSKPTITEEGEVKLC